MSWYKIFYWITVADAAKTVLLVFSIIMTICGVISMIILLRLFEDGSAPSVETRAKRRRWVFWSWPMMILLWLMWTLTPTKRDAMIIIAGGAVGSFITSDSSAKQIPAEFTLLLREKMRSEINELQNPFNVDTLSGKTKEELIELLKKK